MKPFISSIVRHLLSSLGGSLVTIGIASSDANNFISASEPVLTGLILFIAAQAWSFTNVGTVVKVRQWAKRYGFVIK